MAKSCCISTVRFTAGPSAALSGNDVPTMVAVMTKRKAPIEVLSMCSSHSMIMAKGPKFAPTMHGFGRFGKATARSMHRVAGVARFAAEAEIVGVGGEFHAVDDQSALSRRDLDDRAILHLALENELGERILQAALDHALQRPRAEDRIVAGLREPGFRLGVEGERDLAVG